MTPVLAQRPRTERAFERLYRRHVHDVYRYALVVLRSRDDAEDVTQTTFLNAYRAFTSGERPRAAQNWLIALAHQICRQRVLGSEGQLDDNADEAVPDDELPTAHDVRRALGHLPFNERAALVMREVEGRTYSEIAEILDLSSSQVETLIFRARRALREELEGTLTCHEDGQLDRSERRALRAHLRGCADCMDFARSQNEQREALRSFAHVPLPSSLRSFASPGRP